MHGSMDGRLNWQRVVCPAKPIIVIPIASPAACVSSEAGDSPEISQPVLPTVSDKAAQPRRRSLGDRGEIGRSRKRAGEGEGRRERANGSAAAAEGAAGTDHVHPEDSDYTKSH